MSADSMAPGAQQQRFADYLHRLAQAAGHQDRAAPLRLYCTGLLLPGERKSVEPMAARLAPDNVRQTHQSLHHVVADAPWKDEDLLEVVRQYALSAMQKRGPVEAWIVDDTGLVKKGKHSVGVTRQYCGQVGKQENCRIVYRSVRPRRVCRLPGVSTCPKCGPTTASGAKPPEYRKTLVFKPNRKLPWTRSAAPSSVGYHQPRCWRMPLTATIASSAKRSAN